MNQRLTFVFAAIACAAAPAVAQEGRPVSEIVVLGLRSTNEEVVRIAARTAGVREGQAFSNDAFNKAKEALRAKGLYADVFARTEDAPDRRRVRVIF
ncbi:MAG: POTRA domain-containing protein, partial [Armatimonadota bacterium]